MRRRILRNLLVGAAATASAFTSAGFSYWIYVTAQPERTINSNSRIDNIRENYSFGDTSAINQYDIYFYPSAYMLTFFQEGSAQTPEEHYGSINITLNHHGEIVRESIEAKPCSEEVSNLFARTSEIDVGYQHQYVWDIDHYGGTVADMLNYTYLNEPDNPNDRWQGRAALSNAYPNQASDTTHNDVEWREDLDFASSTPKKDEGTPGSISTLDNEKQHPYQQYLNREDRLGYWPNRVPSANDKDGGRYLPIKLSFAGSLPPNIMTTKILDPQTDMGDQRGYHNLEFSNWIYYTKDNEYFNNFLNNYRPTDAFVFQDSVNVFDVGGHLDQYAEEVTVDGKTRYVIRLFPQFSNGKNYKATSADPAKGYRDGQRLDFLRDDQIIDSRYFAYDNSEQNQNNLRFSKLMNVSITNTEVTDYVIRGVKIYGSPNWFGDPKYANNGGWHNFSDDEGNFPSSASLKSGLYNFYIFTTANSYKKNILEREENARNRVRNELVNVINESATDIRSLTGKKLLSITDYSAIKNIPIIGKVSLDPEPGFRPYILMYEEVTEIKAVTDIPVPSVDDSGLSDVNPENPAGFSSPSFDSYLKNNYASAVTLTRQSKPLYGGTTTGFDGQPTFTRNNTGNLVASNPHIYRVDSLDFTQVSSLFFQFRTGADEGKEIEYNLSPLGNDPYAALFRNPSSEDEGWNVDNTIKVEDDTYLYVNASKHVYEVTINGQKALRLKRDGIDTCRGYYNFVLEWTETDGKVVYNVYCHRRKNIFVRIFDECPLVADDNFLDCSPKDTAYYTRSFYIGKGIDPKLETGDKFGSENMNQSDEKTLSEAFVYYCKQRENGTGPGTGKAYYKDTNHTYHLLDYVSGRVLATYNDGNGELSVSDDMVVTKNHAFYIVSKDFYMDRINEIVGLSSD